jgi:DNA repair protein RadC
MSNAHHRCTARADARVYGLLHQFFGARAARLYREHRGSALSVLAAARVSSDAELRRLEAARALVEAAAEEAIRRGPALRSSSEVVPLLKLHFAGQRHESFVGLFLNARHELIEVEPLFRGTLTQTSVYPREIIKHALRVNAAAFICAHCHPSGCCEPSQADEMLTRNLRQALALVDVRLLDHFVVAGSEHVSLAERGLI